MSERCRIKDNWLDAGRTGEVLHRLRNDNLGREWTVVLWDGEEDPDCFKSAGLEPAYRTTKIDCDAGPRPKTDRYCVKCQRDIKPDSPARVIHLIDDGGLFALHPADEALYVAGNRRGDLGATLLGMDCAKTIGLEWSVAE